MSIRSSPDWSILADIVPCLPQSPMTSRSSPDWRYPYRYRPVLTRESHGELQLSCLGVSLTISFRAYRRVAWRVAALLTGVSLPISPRAYRRVPLRVAALLTGSIVTDIVPCLPQSPMASRSYPVWEYPYRYRSVLTAESHGESQLS